MRRTLTVLAAAFLAACQAMAQRAPSVVEARVVLASDGVRAGSSVKTAVVAQIAPGYHINDHKPSLDYLIPSELKIEPLGEMAVENIVYPRGEAKKFAFSDTPLAVYEGTLLVGAVLKVAPKARPGVYTLKGKFLYQACNDHACLPPTNLPLTLEVKVVRRGVPLKRVNEDVFHRIHFE